MKQGFVRAKGSGLALLASLYLANPAFAEDSARTAADSLFSEGVTLMKAGDCNAALIKFRESERLEPASGTLLNLAYCEVMLGHRASAWRTYREASTLAEATHKPQHAQIAREQADRLSAELPRFTPVFEAPLAESVEIRLDGVQLDRSLWTSEIPVDPGTHKLEVVNQNEPIWQREFVARLGDVHRIDVPNPRKPEAPNAAPPSERAVPPQAQRNVRSAPPARQSGAANGPSQSQARSNPTSLFLIAGGAVTFVSGAALFTVARLQYDAAAHDCPRNVCDQSGYDERQSAIGKARAGYVLAGAGTLLLGTGVVLWALQRPTPNAERTAAQLRVTPTASGISLSVRRSF